MSKIFREISERRKSLCHITNSSPISNKKVKGTLGFPLLHVTSTFIPYNRTSSRFPFQWNLEYGLLFLNESIIFFSCGTLLCQTLQNTNRLLSNRRYIYIATELENIRLFFYL